MDHQENEVMTRLRQRDMTLETCLVELFVIFAVVRLGY